MDRLMKRVDPRLVFSRNYEKLRPYAGYREERRAEKKTAGTVHPRRLTCLLQCGYAGYLLLCLVKLHLP